MNHECNKERVFDMLDDRFDRIELRFDKQDELLKSILKWKWSIVGGFTLIMSAISLAAKIIF